MLIRTLFYKRENLLYVYKSVHVRFIFASRSSAVRRIIRFFQHKKGNPQIKGGIACFRLRLLSDISTHIETENSHG